MVSRIWQPSLRIGACARCLTPWNLGNPFQARHVTHDRFGNGFFVLCVDCWGSCSTEKRIEYHKAYIEGRRAEFDSVEEILAGLELFIRGSETERPRGQMVRFLEDSLEHVGMIVCAMGWHNVDGERVLYVLDAPSAAEQDFVLPDGRTFHSVLERDIIEPPT